MATDRFSSQEQSCAWMRCAGALPSRRWPLSLPERLPRRRARGGAQRGFLGVLALLFAVSVAVTVALCRSMSNMGGMEMPGGWTMSMTWMLMPGQTLAGAAASFQGMWVVMMVAMMLPSLAPMLIRYREAVGATAARRQDWLTTLVGIGYFAIWAVIGMVVFGAGFALSAAEMQHENLSRAVPISAGILVLSVGVLQFTAWKARSLACCGETPASDRVLPANAATAWRHGLRLSIDCVSCCLGLMLIVVVLGVMDLRLMAVVTAAITAERLAPNGPKVARAIGWLIIAAGVVLIARAAGAC